MSEINQNKKKKLKELIKQLHMGASPKEIKQRFKHVLEGVSPLEIAKIEEELTNEGMPREELRKLCDVHLEVFKEQLETQKMDIPREHPINILMEEHRILLQLTERLLTITNKVQQTSDKDYADSEIAQIFHISHDFQDAEKHYLREENVLFPILEKHGITEPPAIMWQEHDDIRKMKKILHDLFDENKIDEVMKRAGDLHEMLSNHFYKENNILFPAGLELISEKEWKDIRRQFDEIGYCCFTPELEEIKDEYYDLRGWDKKTGLQSTAELKRLGLDDISDALEKINRAVP